MDDVDELVRHDASQRSPSPCIKARSRRNGAFIWARCSASSTQSTCVTRREPHRTRPQNRRGLPQSDAGRTSLLLAPARVFSGTRLWTCCARHSHRGEALNGVVREEFAFERFELDQSVYRPELIQGNSRPVLNCAANVGNLILRRQTEERGVARPRGSRTQGVVR